MIKYIIMGIISVVAVMQGQVNTEAMRSEDNRIGFSNQFSLDAEYEKAKLYIERAEPLYRSRDLQLCLRAERYLEEALFPICPVPVDWWLLCGCMLLI